MAAAVEECHSVSPAKVIRYINNSGRNLDKLEQNILFKTYELYNHFDSNIVFDNVLQGVRQKTILNMQIS